MIQRIFSGIFGGAILFLLVWFGGLYYTFAIGLLVTLGLLEYVEMMKLQGIQPHTKSMFATSLFLILLLHVVVNYLGYDNWYSIRLSERFLAIFVLFNFLCSWIIVICQGNPEKGFENALANIFGAVYIGLLFAYILLLRYIPGQGGFYVFFTILVTWANDSAAYFTGITLGKHKLSPLISPKKSVEGSIGGLIGGVCLSVAMALMFNKQLWAMILLGVSAVIAGQFGDLVESVVKRNSGVKDSGRFLPGHGGVLDRFDSLLLAAPVVYYLVVYILPC